VSRAKKSRGSGSSRGSAATADAAARLALEALADVHHGLIERAVGQRLIERLEAQAIREADLVRVEWRTLVAVEQGDGGQPIARVTPDSGLDVGRGRIATDDDRDVALDDRQGRCAPDLRNSLRQWLQNIQVEQREGDVLGMYLICRQ
jgi:hypothetical protein